jgi:steroid 5-alpha reductase family enzyme
LAAGLAAMTSQDKIEADIFLVIGTLIWILGFSLEVIADNQKSKFRSNPENKDKFISIGIWSWSRHPNYFGEILLWIGITIIALPVLKGWQFVTLISPLFIIILLTQISGVRLLELRGKKKWGNDEEYKSYIKNTSVLIPLPPKD